MVRRSGLSTDWMDDSDTKMKVLICATPGFMLDIGFNNSVIQTVTLHITDAPDIVSKHLERAGNILLRNLEIGLDENPYTKDLDQFAANLERLAALDKLSGNGFSCHEAIAGVYESLERVHKWEVKKIKEGKPEIAKRDLAYVERLAMCTRSGRPSMHVRDRIGLSLDYWQTKRLISSPTTAHEKEQTWSLLVECAPTNSLSVFQPLRVSQDWISKNIAKDVMQVDLYTLNASKEGQVLDWQEPENKLFPTNDAPKGDAMEGVEQAPTQKVPEAMFVAKFDPPLVVPMNVAMDINNKTQAQLDMYTTSTFDELMFPPGADSLDNNGSRTIHSETTTPVFTREGGSMNLQTEKKHHNTLLIDKISYGRTLTEFPFAHPKDFVEMLPWLRQYAFLSSLLSKTFGPEHQKPKTKTTTIRGSQLSKNEEFALFMSNSPQPEVKKDVLKLDVTLQIDSDTSKLRVIFPFRDDTADVTFLVKGNAVLEVESENFLGGQRGAGRKLGREDLARMLEVTEDLGVWVEFVRARLG